MAKHEIVKARHELKRRKITVTEVSEVTPKMRRIAFAAHSLKGFVSPSPDDHIKIFVASEPGGEPEMRDFTPRTFDSDAGTLVLEFALHESGPASNWARNAKLGDELEIGGPRGSTIVPDDFDWYLMVGDRTALPSFGRRLESLRPGVPVTTLVEVDNAEERQAFLTDAAWTSRWVYEAAGQSTRLEEAIADLVLPPGDGFVWIALEAAASRKAYQLLVEQKGHPAEWIKASAYWSL